MKFHLAGSGISTTQNRKNSAVRFSAMKLLTHNFLHCAAKTCKASPNAFPLKFDQVELSRIEMDYNPQFLINVLPRVDWPALIQTCIEVSPIFIFKADNSLVITVYLRKNQKICRQSRMKSYYGYCTRHFSKYVLKIRR